MARPVVVLPQPDSPTSARVCPERKLNDTSCTAATAWLGRNKPPPLWKVTLSDCTSSNSGGCAPTSAGPMVGFASAAAAAAAVAPATTAGGGALPASPVRRNQQ